MPMPKFDPMHQRATPKAQPTYEILPEGKYTAIIKSIADWKPKDAKGLVVYAWDDDYKKVKDSDGKDITSIMDTTTYTAEIEYELTEPGFEGRTIRSWLNLHPNMPWAFPAFLDACGVLEDIFPDEIKAHCLGAEVLLTVAVETKKKDVQNKQTGITESKEVTRNEVKRVSAIDVEV